MLWIRTETNLLFLKLTNCELASVYGEFSKSRLTVCLGESAETGKW